MGAIAKFATDGIQPGERLRYWNTIADEVFSGTFVNAESQRFEGDMWSWRVGNLDMIRTRSVNASVGRRPLDSAEERVILHMQWRGHGQHRQDQREARLDPGDFILGSPHIPYRFDLSAHEMMVVEFPKGELAELVPDLDDAMARRLSGASPSARVFNDFLLSLWRLAEDQPDDEEWASGINRVFYDLAALAIRDARRHEADLGAGAQLRRRALSLIDAALADPALSSASIAAELGTSVRTVQNVFTEMGTTPSAAILERRLKKAAERLIADPDASVTEIAFAHGFNDSAYFSRCFRRTFSTSPRDWRLGRRPG